MLKKGLVIYEPTGKALEYAPLAVNLYKGCNHGCRYCYAAAATWQNPTDFSNAIPRPGILDRLKVDAPKAAQAGAIGQVLLCFTCDPYQPLDDDYHLAGQAIEILHASGFLVTVLTKGGTRAQADFDLYWPGDQFATTMTFLDEKQSLDWEPKAATPAERIRTLIEAHSRGFDTWVSLEPVLDPAQSLDIIRQIYNYVDLFKVGKLNYPEKLPEPYRSQVNDIDWGKFGREAVDLLCKLHCNYYIKNDLKRLM